MTDIKHTAHSSAPISSEMDRDAVGGSDQLRCALRSAQQSLSTAVAMTNSVLALFEAIDIWDILSDARYSNGFELISAVEVCLGKITAEANDSLKLVDPLVCASGAAHG